MVDFKTFQKVSVVIAITILLNVFINYGRQAFYPEPKWDKFCKENFSIYTTKEACEKDGGRWITDQTTKDGMMAKPISATDPNSPKNYCDPNYTCQKEFEKANQEYNKKFFIAYLFGGLIMVLGGLAITTASSVSLGVLYGGIVLLFTGVTRFWPEMSDMNRFLIIGFVLAVFIWIGYKKLK
jgi:hypothetical protein